MRILIVSQYFWPENFRVNDLAAELQRRGHSVTILAGLPNYPEGVLNPRYACDPADYATYEGVRIVRVWQVLRGHSRMQLAFNYASYVISACTVGAWRLRGQRFNLVLAYQLSPSTIGLVGVFYKWLKSARLVMWVFDLWPETLQAMGALKSGVGLKAVNRMMRFVYDRCDRVMAQSRSMTSIIAGRCRDTDKVMYLPIWAEAAFDSRGVRPADEVPFEPDKLNVMFAGNIGEAQDFPAILRAADLLRDEVRVRWLIVGDGSQAAWVNGEVARLGLSDRFLMLGRYPLGRMPSFFAHASALLVSLQAQPNFGIVVPGKLQSYLAAGVPVLAMLDGEGAGLIKESGAGFAVKAGDSAALAHAIRAMARLDSNELKLMGDRGRELAVAEFNRGRLVTRLEQVFATLAVGRQSGSPSW